MADNVQTMPANLLDEGQSYIEEKSSAMPTTLISEPSSTAGINPLVPSIVGAGLGVAAPIPRHIAENLANIRARQMMERLPEGNVTVEGAGGPSPGAKYAAKTGYGMGPGYTVEEVVEAHKTQNKPIGSGKISSKIGRNEPMNIDALQALEQQKLEEAARRAATLKMEAEAAMSPLQRGATKAVEKVVPTKLQNVAGAIDEAFVPASKQWWARGIRGTGRGLQGGMATAQAIDAINKGQEGDVPGAVMSGIGAAGNLASFIPNPVTRVGGTLIGALPFAGNLIGSANAAPADVSGAAVDLATGLMGAPGLALSPSQLGEATVQPKREVYRPGMTDILKGTTLPQGHAEGGDVKKPSAGIAGVNPDANESGAFIGYPQINRNRQVGSGTGFLDALVGAPPSRTNVLNPSDYSYMSGYEKGEPYGIASMALPFVGAAAKPLAKEVATRAFMGESLTPKMMRGLMPEQPVSDIITYHGTPHDFDKFNLSEIGQGEGSQAFGHGIYLAESPGVAKGYQQALSGQMATPEDLSNYFKPGEVRKKMGGYDKVISFHPATENKNWHTVVQEVVKNKEGEWIPHPSYGRPRAHSTTPDPLDFKQNMDRELGPAGYLYKVDVPDEHIAKMVDWDLPFKEQPQHIQDAFAKVNPIAVMQKDPSNEFTRWLRLPNTAKVLQEMDIPGIKYLDRGSRFGNQTTKTQNFVVFDPDKSTKILERNNEPVGPLSNPDLEQ
jgi:hypothetical protein